MNDLTAPKGGRLRPGNVVAMKSQQKEGTPPPPPTEGDGLIPGLPIVALGRGNGVSHYLDEQRQYRPVADKEHTRLVMLGMVGTKVEMLYKVAPRLNAEGQATGWKPEFIAELMQHAAAERGLFDPMEKIRGRGSWRGTAGELYLHCGDQIVRIRGDGVLELLIPGLHGGFCYPAAPPGPRPDGKFAERTVARKVLQLLGGWNFRRPEISPIANSGASRVLIATCCWAGSARQSLAALSAGGRTCG